MSTRVDMLGKVRRELWDNGPAFVWSDAQLYDWMAEAFQQVSLDLPVRKYGSMYLVPGQREYSLNAYVAEGLNDALVQVNAPRGKPVPTGDTNARQEGLEQQNTLLATDQAARIYENCWEVKQFTAGQPYLVFRYAPIAVGGPEDRLVEFWYIGQYKFPSDDTTPFEMHFSFEPLITYYVCWRALAWLAEQRGKRADPAAGRQRSNTAGFYEKLYRDGVGQRKRQRPARMLRVTQDV